MTDKFHHLRDQSVGAIAAQLPGASAVFRRFGIEFCCQGHVPLAEVASHSDLDLNDVEGELDALDPSAAPDAPQENTHFPALQKQTPGDIKLSIRFMRHDQTEFAFFLDQIDRLTDDCTPPEVACAAWRVLYADMSEFKVDLIERVHLENDVLFPRFENASQD